VTFNNILSITLCGFLLSCCSPFEALKGQPCEATSYPMRAQLPNVGDAVDFDVVVRAVDFGDYDEGGVPAYTKLGFDLDDTCGAERERDRCTPPAWASPPPDNEYGRDNSAGSYLNRSQASVTDATNSTSDSGLITTLIRVRNYNGSSVDNDVQVEWMAVTRLPEDGFVPVPPEWDGQDGWYPLAEFVENADTSSDAGLEPELTAKYADRSAYVTDHMLVARFPELLSIVGKYTKAVLVARVIEGEHGWTLTEGMAGARMHVDDMLALIDGHTDDETGEPICIDSPVYAERKAHVCALADISASGTDDPDTYCDAVSWAWAFETDPAVLIERPRHNLVPPPRCPEEVAPRNDHCEPPGGS